MSFLLDTDICSNAIKRPASLFSRFVQHSGRLYIPSIGLGELYTWAYMRDTAQRLQSVRDFLLGVNVVQFDERCAEKFGETRGTLLRQGHNKSGPDLMIACVALVHDYTLVTHNTADFQNIPGLLIEDWLA